jgi:predicted DNA repair protein MutK
MATGLLALLDDIATIADDVATLTAAAGKKTAGIVTDDMAVTAEQAVGLRREREIAVVLAVAKGSLRNKCLILTPAALALNAVAPWAITPILMVGGAYLAFEGTEKILHWGQKSEEEVGDTAITDPEAFERSRIEGATRTDFILSAEIIAISLGTVKAAPFLQQVATLYVISVVMTVGVYGLVAGLVKVDDLGEHLALKGGPRAALGQGLVRAMPYVMKGISAIGTGAMLLVGGQILVHGIPAVHHLEQELLHGLPLQGLWTSLSGMAAGGIAGLVVIGVLKVVGMVRKKASPSPAKG